VVWLIRKFAERKTRASNEALSRAAGEALLAAKRATALAQKASEDLQELRDDLSAANGQLSTAVAELEVAKAQNRTLWKMHERFAARVDRDTALLQREMTDAQNAAMSRTYDEPE